MRQYCRFLSKDLISALDGNIGRNEKLIYEIFKIYFIITSKKYNIPTKEKAIKSMEKLMDNYLSEGDVNSYNLMYSKLENSMGNGHITVASIMLNDLTINFRKYIIAQISYKKINPTAPYFKQALIEFNNMLLHLFNFYCNEIEKDENSKRAKTHLHRGTLDFYKTLIRDKKSGFTQNQKQEIINIRLQELGTIGKDIEKDKRTLPTQYCDFVEKLYPSI